MTDLAISRIHVGERRREDMGDLQGLAESIEKYGLLHPVVVDEEAHLVAGGRRLVACQMLGWSMVPVTYLGDLTEAERREIELEENLRRKDLTAYEENKALVVKVERTAEAISTKLEEKAPQGRKADYSAPKADIAQATGSSVGAIVRAEQHVETAESYPFMQSPDWSQNAVLTARKQLEAMPEPVRETVAELISQPGVPVKEAMGILTNVREMPKEAQAEIVSLHQSEDHRQRDLALTKAAAKPPMPDPQLGIVREIGRQLHQCIRKYPSDPWTPRLQAVRVELQEVEELIRIHGKETP